MNRRIPRVDVTYSEENGWASWQSKRQTDGAPDKWPYGLDRLAEYAEFVNAIDMPKLAPVDLVRLAARSGPRSRKSGRDGLAVGISWDERAALRMATRDDVDCLLSGVIWATDNHMSGNNRIRNAVTRRVLRRFDRVWCLSSAQIAPTADWLGVERDRVSFLPFGIDAEFWSYERPSAGPPVIVSVGNDRDRDPETLFAALDIIIKSVPDVRALVQSDTTSTPPKGVEMFSRVTHEKLRTIYQGSTLVMVATKPNLHVSGMTVALEAMATGRPVVMSDTPGMRDYVPDGISGFLAKVGDPERMASAAIKIIESPDLCNQMANDGRRLVEEKFNSGAMAARIAALVQDSLPLP